MFGSTYLHLVAQGNIAEDQILSGTKAATKLPL